MIRNILRNRKKKNPAAELEHELRYQFRSKELLLQALTHSSFAYESSEKSRDNELMEFLGDSVVGLIAAAFFYESYPEVTEGDLSKLKSSATSTIALAEYARQIRLDQFMRVGRGEEKSGGRKKDSILAGTFEAVLGAVFLDGGYKAAKDVYLRLVRGSFKKIKDEDQLDINNYKSALQEFLQKEDLPSPHYKLLKSTGPDHHKEFVVEVLVNKTVLAQASGPSRKAAELKAAEKALKSFFGKKIKALTQETFIFKT
jgi:ribonuclease III